MRRYHLHKLHIREGEKQAASWTFAQMPVKGMAHSFQVTDHNFARPHSWDFVIRFPDKGTQSIEVRPVQPPPLKAWAQLDRSSIIFNKSTRGSRRGKLYCKIFLAVPNGEKTKQIVRFADRWELPNWCDPLQYRATRKKTVRSTKSTDGEHLVLLVSPSDTTAMIHIFFATKVWVLKERFTISE